MKRALVFLAIAIVLFVAATSFAAQAPSSSPLLPQIFAGWTRAAHSQVSKDPAAADSTNAAVLKEDGFTDFEQADYTQPDRKCAVKAIRFADASGAYSAFTYYTPPQLEPIDMGSNDAKDSLGFSQGNVATFFRQNVLVTMTFDRVTPMTPAAVRELASMLPAASGPAQNLPNLAGYLPRPKRSFINNSEKYFAGPVALSQAGSPVPMQVIGFTPGSNVEAVTAKYATGDGTATLMIVSYPTPAIAAERERAINAYQPAGPAASAELAPPFNVKRTGPLVVLTAGRISSSDAKSLLASVNYEADVTWNQNTHVDDYGGFLLNLILLIGLMLTLCIVAGVAFGGFRIFMKKFFPGRFFERPDEVEIIQLKIGK